jgi:hypothetical protein
MPWTFWGMVVIAVVAVARGVYWDTKARSVGAERDKEMGLDSKGKVKRVKQ